jgi:hypothetical protein
MAAKTTNTIWPDNVPVAVKDTIEEFFQLLDGYTPQAARQWSELYLPTGNSRHSVKSSKAMKVSRFLLYISSIHTGPTSPICLETIQALTRKMRSSDSEPHSPLLVLISRPKPCSQEGLPSSP